MNTQRPARMAVKDESEIAAHGRLITLEEGVYALSFPTAAPAGAVGGVRLPAIQVFAPPSDDYNMVEVITGTGDLPKWWCDSAGGVVVVKAPPGGGVVLVMTFGPTALAEAVDIEIRWLGPAVGAIVAAPEVDTSAPAHLSGRPPEPLRSELLLHIEREGDRKFEAPGWAGTRGQRRRLEAFSLRPLGTLKPGDIEYKAFGLNGWQTPWTTDAQLCGTRGRALPLTGFAMRVVADMRDRFDVIYEGAFFGGEVSGTKRNGEPCMSTIKDNPLEAINVSIVPHRGR